MIRNAGIIWGRALNEQIWYSMIYRWLVTPKSYKLYHRSSSHGNVANSCGFSALSPRPSWYLRWTSTLHLLTQFCKRLRTSLKHQENCRLLWLWLLAPALWMDQFEFLSVSFESCGQIWIPFLCRTAKTFLGEKIKSLNLEEIVIFQTLFGFKT